jgi:hypothetical protein
MVYVPSAKNPESSRMRHKSIYIPYQGTRMLIPDKILFKTIMFSYWLFYIPSNIYL